MTAFQQVMLNLDVALTGHTPKEVGRQIHHQPASVEAWLSHGGGNPIYYLDDGGYSRVVFGLESGRLFLTSNSRQKVKDRWEAAKPQVEAAENYIRSELNRMEPGFYESIEDGPTRGYIVHYYRQSNHRGLMHAIFVVEGNPSAAKITKALRIGLEQLAGRRLSWSRDDLGFSDHIDPDKLESAVASGKFDVVYTHADGRVTVKRASGQTTESRAQQIVASLLEEEDGPVFLPPGGKINRFDDQGFDIEHQFDPQLGKWWHYPRLGNPDTLMFYARDFDEAKGLYVVDVYRRTLNGSWTQKTTIEIPFDRDAEAGWRPAIKPAMMESHEEIAVDLDGTLAKDSGWKGISHIGDPVPKMLKRVQDWIADGKKVVIFTARAHDPKAIPHIEKWLKKHGLPRLEVTNEKRPAMVSFWDDKAVEVKHNKGLKESEAKRLIMGIDPWPIKLSAILRAAGRPIHDVDGIEVYGLVKLPDDFVERTDGPADLYGVSIHLEGGGLEDVGEYGTPKEARAVAADLTRLLPNAHVIDEISDPLAE